MAISLSQKQRIGIDATEIADQSASLLAPNEPLAALMTGATSDIELTEAKRRLAQLEDKRELVEESLRQSEERYRMFLDGIQNYAIFMMDPSGQVVSWNAGAERIKGYKNDEIIGRNFSCFFPPEEIERGRPAEVLRLTVANGQHEEQAIRMRKDGSRFLANTVLTALRDPDGELQGFSEFSHDLSESKESEAKYRGLLEAAPDAIVVVNQGGEIVLLNLQAERQFGYYRDELIGQPVKNIIPEGFAERLIADGTRSAAEALAQQIGTGIELIGRRKDGSKFPIEIMLSPLENAEGILVTAAIRDISVRKRAEEHQKKLQDKLELEQLLREKRIEALSHMAGGLAHEISNPLAIIHARASDLRSLAASGAPVAATDVQEACDGIVRTSDRAIKILHGLRGFAREGSQDPMALASIREIAEECLELQQARFERHRVELRLHFNSEVPDILCREIQIGQIVTNLLNNAFDSIVQSDSTERWISLATGYAGSGIYVDVSDSGPGIEDHFKVHLMEPFFSTKEAHLGMGVGLSLSRAIAQDHGGTLVLCKDTVNTCFRLVLPIEPGGSDQEEDHLVGVACQSK
jgi:PAS domain S-box-containing protein